MRHLLILLLALGFGLSAVTGWPQAQSGTTIPVPIDGLVDQPTSFDRKDVSVIGVVTAGASLLGYGGFLLQQPGQTAEVLVLSGNGIPSIGSRIVVAGRVFQLFTWNDCHYPVIVRSR